MKLTDEQQAIIDYSGDLKVVACAGSGKAQPLTSKVLTPDGFVMMGDLRVGDKVVTPSGSISEITQISPQGVKDVYETSYRDGRTSLSCKDHLWKVYNYGWSKAAQSDGTGYRVVTTGDLMSYKFNNTSYFRYYIPLVNPSINLKNTNDLPIHPYVFGALIGDGSFRDRTIKFSNESSSVVTKMNSLLPSGYKLVRDCREYHYRVSSQQPGIKGQLIINAIKDLGLFDLKSEDKFIPKMYLNSSIGNRIELIRGLFDTDGSYDDSISYSTSSELLANDVQSLIWSVGGICSISKRQTHFTYKGVKKPGLPSYRLNVRFTNPKMLYSNEVHTSKFVRDYQYENLRLEIKEIKYHSTVECQCIMIDDPEHLYITDDFIITHNSSTLVEYTKARPGKKFLYIVFNKSAREDAEKKFAKNGCKNVKIVTAHSLAYNRIIPKYNYKVVQSHNLMDLVLRFKLKPMVESFALIQQSLGLLEGYYNSAHLTLKSYVESVFDTSTFKNFFMAKNHMDVFKFASRLHTMMDNGELEVTHSFYLKKFQLDDPEIRGYDYILYDEFQDSNAPMVSVFLNQDATRICVGDPSQQIYSWRGATNALDTVDFSEFPLTASFRFNQEIADMANRALDLKKVFNKDHHHYPIRGLGHHEDDPKQLTYVGRKNVSLLDKAFNTINRTSNIYFEGGLTSYTFMEGTGLFDVYNLIMNKRDKIYSPMLKHIKNRTELNEYIESSGDANIGTLVGIVDKFRHEVPSLYFKLKESALPADKKEQAEVIFTTTHKSKGLEYDKVVVIDDFYKRDELEELAISNDGGVNMNEEVNLLYVAITRGLKGVTYAPFGMAGNPNDPTAPVKKLVRDDYDDMI